MTCRSEGHPFGHVGVKHSGKREESGPKGHAGCDVSMRRTAGSQRATVRCVRWRNGARAGVQGCRVGAFVFTLREREGPVCCPCYPVLCTFSSPAPSNHSSLGLSVSYSAGSWPRRMQRPMPLE